MAETIQKCFDEKNTRFQDEKHIIDPNDLKINDIFNIPQIVRTLKSAIVVPVLNEIIDSHFIESLIELIAKESDEINIFDYSFDWVKSSIEMIILPMMEKQFFQADFQVNMSNSILIAL